MKTRFVLINTSHAGNVGAAARAMKTMGFDDLVLVAPRWPNVLRGGNHPARQRRPGCAGQRRIVATLDEALDGMSHLCATAMTPRDFGPPTARARDFEALLKKSAWRLLHQRQRPKRFKPKLTAVKQPGAATGRAKPAWHFCSAASALA
jgi:tRNA/rRNA methyltransferase